VTIDREALAAHVKGAVGEVPGLCPGSWSELVPGRVGCADSEGSGREGSAGREARGESAAAGALAGQGAGPKQ
jgi:hypothetical protein